MTLCGHCHSLWQGARLHQLTSKRRLSISRPLFLLLTPHRLLILVDVLVQLLTQYFLRRPAIASTNDAGREPTQ